MVQLLAMSFQTETIKLLGQYLGIKLPVACA